MLLFAWLHAAAEKKLKKNKRENQRKKAGEKMRKIYYWGKKNRVGKKFNGILNEGEKCDYVKR